MKKNTTKNKKCIGKNIRFRWRDKKMETKDIVAEGIEKHVLSLKMREIEKFKEYIKGVLGTIKGRPDAECIEMLREKVEFWHSSARFWRNEFLEVSEEEFWWG